MSKLPQPIILALIILLTIIMLLGGCITIYKEGTEPASPSPSPSSSQPASQSAGVLSEAVLSKNVDSKTMLPVDKTSTFTPDTPAIYCTFKVNNTPPGTEVRVKWFYIKGEQKSLENSMVYEDASKFSGTARGMFGLKMPSVVSPMAIILLSSW